MSTLFAEIRLDSAPAEDLFPLFQASAEPPGDGDSVRSWGWAALGCRAFWSTPEEIGERQPLVDPAGRCALLFDGRLDNREELVRELGLPGEEAARTSDAALVLRSLVDGWGALERFIGPWALLFLDLRSREAHLARDPTGERMLCWHATPARLLVAGEPAVLLADPGVPREADEATLAAFFATRQPAPEATFFRAVRQVPAGCRVVLSAGAERCDPFWRPDLGLLRPRSEAESVERFRELLTTAVRAQLRAPGPAAVLMSGGLDSTTVAAHAAREQKRRGGAPVRAVSWRFQELAAADESAFAQAMMTAAGLAPVWVDGDGCWPLRGLDESTTDRSLPFDNPYRVLHGAAFSATVAGGSRALLTGHFSDEMYHGVEAWWLRDALARGAWAAAVAGVRGELRYRSRPDVWTPGCRRALAVLLLGAAGESLRPRRLPAWLTPVAREFLRPNPPPLAAGSAARHPEQGATLFAPFALMGIAVEMRRARQHGLELRLPFRDRRLLELVLRLPADHLARPGWRKRLVWLAGEGWLPDAVRLRTQMSDLGALFARGIGEREHAAVRRLLFGPGPQLWRRWVVPAALEDFLATAGAGGAGLPTLVFWRCLAAELWARSWHGA